MVHKMYSKNVTWINFRISNEDVEKIDKLVFAKRSTRSAVVRELVVSAIGNYEAEKGVIL